MFALNLCLKLMAINCNWSLWPQSIIQQEISIMKLPKPPLTYLISHSTFSTHCTNLFFYFSCIFTFLEVIKHNMPKMLLICLFSSNFNIKMVTQKFTSFDKFFKCILIWQLSQCDLTKLLQMKLKTTKCY